MRKLPVSLLCSLLLGTVAAAAVPAASAQIFRSVDEHGNVVFSDVPPRDDGSKQVQIAPLNTFAPPAPPPPPAAPASAAAAVDAQYYAALEIVAPTNDMAVRENAGNVAVSVATVPPVRSDHRLVLLLDGSVLPVEAEGGVFLLTNVDRGTHTLTTRIVDGSDATIKESAPVTFHLLRASVQ
jgi:hypothetical protein